jgi:hypothetical protein
MRNIPIAQYSFYLQKGKPFIKIGDLECAVYWGAKEVYGGVPPITFGAKELSMSIPFSLDYTTERFFGDQGIEVDVVLGYYAFAGQSFTLDLTKELVTFYDNRSETPLTFTGKGAHFLDEIEIPTATAQVGTHTVLLQVDIGDELSILPQEVLVGCKPTGEKELCHGITGGMPVLSVVYEVPIKISDEVTVRARARSVLSSEERAFQMLGTHGALGLDLIRHHPATFHWGLNPVVRGYSTMLFLHTAE